MKAMGTARVKVDYVGPAPMEGSDDSVLLASLRTDGSPANMIGFPTAPTMVAEAETPSIFSLFSGRGGGAQATSPPPAPPEPPAPVEVASRPPPAPDLEPPAPRVATVAEQPAVEPPPADVPQAEPSSPPPVRQRRVDVPLPPQRPFDLGSNRSAFVVAAVAASPPAHAVMPPRRPELHARAGKALDLAVERPSRDKKVALRTLGKSKSSKADD
jgi:rare lipoprotein A